MSQCRRRRSRQQTRLHIRRQPMSSCRLCRATPRRRSAAVAEPHCPVPSHSRLRLALRPPMMKRVRPCAGPMRKLSARWRLGARWWWTPNRSQPMAQPEAAPPPTRTLSTLTLRRPRMSRGAVARVRDPLLPRFPRRAPPPPTLGWSRRCPPAPPAPPARSPAACAAAPLAPRLSRARAGRRRTRTAEDRTAEAQPCCHRRRRTQSEQPSTPTTLALRLTRQEAMLKCRQTPVRDHPHCETQQIIMPTPSSPESTRPKRCITWSEI
mmetsp:Transcript_499/g.1483  ORF Transcript_499/g.1483 Transcript_499/m.1483 type:complete len:266 (+) Transcript_499:2607-3404(+)